MPCTASQHQQLVLYTFKCMMHAGISQTKS